MAIPLPQPLECRQTCGVKYSHLEDDSDILSQWIHILEGKLEGDSIGVEVGTVLYSRVGKRLMQCGPQPGREITLLTLKQDAVYIPAAGPPRPCSLCLPDFPGTQSAFPPCSHPGLGC